MTKLLNRYIIFSVFAFLALQIYLPKVLVLGIPVYFFTLNYIFVLGILGINNKITVRHNIEKSYYIYLLACFISALGGNILHQVFHTETFLLLFKYFIPITVFSSVYYIRNKINLNFIKWLYFSQVLFIIITGAYVLYNHIAEPQSIRFLSGSYTQEYRLIGFTGFALSDGKMVSLGSTSVSMGVYVALILLISMQRLADSQNIVNLLIAVALFICLMLTYSRAGLLAFFPGLIIYLIFNWKKRIIFYFIIIILGFITYLFVQFNILEVLNLFGSLGKVINTIELENSGILTNKRFQMWSHGYHFLKENPYIIFTGVGHGGPLVEKVTGIAFYESAFYQAFVEMGFLGVLLLLLHFLLVIYYLLVGLKREKDRLKIWIFKGYSLFMPGFILSNLFGSNMLQTDFIAPIFYGFLAVCYYVHDLNSSEKTDINNSS